MPFTLAHPAASVPFAHNKKFVLSALFIGSMAPDFEYFIPWVSDGHFGHVALGAVVFSIPMACLVYIVFHLFLKKPLVSLLPTSHQKKLAPLLEQFTFGPSQRIVLTLVSIIIGVLTHLIWDSFTHWYGWFVRLFPILRRTLFHIGNSDIPVYSFLQYGSSIIGVGLLFYWYFRWYKTTTLESEVKVASYSEAVRMKIIGGMILGCLLSGLIFTLIFNIIDPFPIPMKRLAIFFHDLAIFILSVSLIEIVLYSVVWKFQWFIKPVKISPRD
jgi:hypothetical protein